MPINVIFDAPPTPPSSTDKTNFRLRYDAFLAYIQSIGTKLITFVTQINDLEANVNAKEASAVAASNIAIALTNYKGLFIQGTSSALVGESWGYGVFFYKCSVNTSNNPILEPASWTPLSVGAQIHLATSKTTPVDADEFGIWDSVASVLKKVTFANLWSYIKVKTDLIYAPIGAGNALLAEYVVSGSPITSIDFNGLDINLHKSYRVEINFPICPSNFGLYIFANGDNTLTNYWNQFVQASGASIATSRGNSPQVHIGANNAGSSSVIDIHIAGGYMHVFSKNIRTTPASVEYNEYRVEKVSTVSNITQLTFTASVSSAIGIGSKIRIYRGDM